MNNKYLFRLTFISNSLNVAFYGFVIIMSTLAIQKSLYNDKHLANLDYKFDLILIDISPSNSKFRMPPTNRFFEEEQKRRDLQKNKQSIEVIRRVKRKIIPHKEIVIEPDKIVPTPPRIQSHIIIKRLKDTL